MTELNPNSTNKSGKRLENVYIFVVLLTKGEDMLNQLWTSKEEASLPVSMVLKKKETVDCRLKIT